MSQTSSDSSDDMSQEEREIKIKALLEKLDDFTVRHCPPTVKKNEEFYQRIVEAYLGGTHMKVECGVTDVTTNDIHAEIKDWKEWKYALGQLIVYNVCEPRDRLQMYLFGNYLTTYKIKAINVLKTINVEVFEFYEDNAGNTTIVSHDSHKAVFVNPNKED
jgi:hypothetical protein